MTSIKKCTFILGHKYRVIYADGSMRDFIFKGSKNGKLIFEDANGVLHDEDTVLRGYVDILDLGLPGA